MIRIVAAFCLTALLWIGAQAQFFNPAFVPIKSSSAAIGTLTDQLSASNTSGATLALTPTANIATGSAIVICVHEKNANGSVGTLADNAGTGNTYTDAGNASPAASNTNGRFSMWYVLNAGAVTTGNAWTYTKGVSGTAATINAVSFTYTGTLSVDANNAITTGSSVSPLNPSSGTTSPTGGATDMFIACVGMPRASADTFTQSSGFSTGPDAVAANTSATSGLIGGHLTSSTGQAYAPTITSRPWAAKMMLFKAS